MNFLLRSCRQEARGQVKPAVHLCRPGLRWGDILLPESEATTGFLAVRAAGSGKTIMLRLCSSISASSDRRGRRLPRAGL